MNTGMYVMGAAALLLAMSVDASADGVRLKNGDTLNGTVVSLDQKHLTLTSDNFGKLVIPRDKVEVIGLGEEGLAALEPKAEPKGGAPGVSDDQRLDEVVPLMKNPQVEQQLNQLLGGGLGGSSLGDLMNRAGDARRGLKDLQQDFGDGPEAKALDAYIQMFDQLLPAEPAKPQPRRRPNRNSTQPNAAP